MKRHIKLIISLGLHAVDGVRAFVLRCFGRRPAGTCVILYYHPVTNNRRGRFSAQMDVLRRLTRPLRADHDAPLEPGRRCSILTFDDAYVSVLENALPVLRERAIPSTIFVPSGSLGGPPKWVRDPSHPFATETVMNHQQLEALRDDPLVTVGSHSISHPNFTRLSPEDARAEFAESKATLEEILGKPINTFSFPHGAHGAGLIEMARAAGYTRIFTITPESLSSLSGQFTCGRVSVDPDDWPLEFRLKLLGAYRWMAWLARSGKRRNQAVPANSSPSLVKS